MSFGVLATDYDNTIATNGQVEESTVAALRAVRDSGRKVLLVTGRTLDELEQVFDEPELFTRVVAENGALLYNPHDDRQRLLTDPIPQRFVAELRRRGVSPLAVGRAICSTWYPHRTTVLEAIHDLGLDLHVIFNKGSVMILPAGVNKATGLRAVLEELQIPPREVVAVGDAENDLSMISIAGCGVAVANALESVKTRADLVTSQAAGAGVEELAEGLLRDDLAGMLSRADQRAG